MMELGACVCTVHQPPACFSCPINQHCNAYADVQQFLADGGDAADTDMPLVTQYPAKASRNGPETLWTCEEDLGACARIA